MSKFQESIPIEECGEKMEKLSEAEFVLEPVYFNLGYNQNADMYLRVGIIDKLREAKKFLPKGWNFKIWDGYRTLKTQKILYDNYWNILKKEHPDWIDSQVKDQVEMFVAPASYDKKHPSPHNTGGTVDLTLVDENLNEIEMGSMFDEFNEKSFSDYFLDKTDGKNVEYQRNRLLLRKTLESMGFANFWDEWWHFSYGTIQWADTYKAPMAIYGSTEL